MYSSHSLERTQVKRALSFNSCAQLRNPDHVQEASIAPKSLPRPSEPPPAIPKQRLICFLPLEVGFFPFYNPMAIE